MKKMKKNERMKKKSGQPAMVTLTHFITTYHISLVKVQTNYCNNNLLILGVKQLNKINIFFIIKKKALLARVKLRCIMGCPGLKSSYQEKGTLHTFRFYHNTLIH